MYTLILRMDNSGRTPDDITVISQLTCHYSWRFTWRHLTVISTKSLTRRGCLVHVVWKIELCLWALVGEVPRHRRADRPLWDGPTSAVAPRPL